MKIKGKTALPPHIDPIVCTVPQGNIISFNVEYNTEIVENEFNKPIRQIEVCLFAEIKDLQEYKLLHQYWFGVNFIKTTILCDNSVVYIDDLFYKLKQKKILFDAMVIEASINFEDPEDNFYSEFSHFHGISFTVNGKKYLNLLD